MPAEEWRVALASTVREATGADLVHIVTCPPGDWGQFFQATTHPFDYATLTARAQSFLPRIEACGEGFAYALAHHGLVYAPLDVARHRDLAEEMRAAFLAPAGLRGWVVTSMVDERGDLIGVIASGSTERSEAMMARDADDLRRVANLAASTLGGAVRLAAGCRPPAAAQPKPPLAREGLSELLTPREREIARLVADGLRNANIAARLGIAEATVAVHLKRIFAKLGIASRVDLALRFRR
jgi:DNA-binding NarL/FixJ family response regulator